MYVKICLTYITLCSYLYHKFLAFIWNLRMVHEWSNLLLLAVYPLNASHLLFFICFTKCISDKQEICILALGGWKHYRLCLPSPPSSSRIFNSFLMVLKSEKSSGCQRITHLLQTRGWLTAHFSSQVRENLEKREVMWSITRAAQVPHIQSRGPDKWRLSFLFPWPRNVHVFNLCVLGTHWKELSFVTLYSISRMRTSMVSSL